MFEVFASYCEWSWCLNKILYAPWLDGYVFTGFTIFLSLFTSYWEEWPIKRYLNFGTRCPMWKHMCSGIKAQRCSPCVVLCHRSCGWHPTHISSQDNVVAVISYQTCLATQTACLSHGRCSRFNEGEIKRFTGGHISEDYPRLTVYKNKKTSDHKTTKASHIQICLFPLHTEKCWCSSFVFLGFIKDLFLHFFFF